MAWMNLAAILMLLKVGIAVLKDYERQKKAGLDPVFDPEKAGIKDANLWSVIKEKYLEQ
ncbi:MAG: alanine:cation symporter family protein [Lawsonibacter sp.]|jgi:AGCS family alanine or glycine:cation symporter|nr:alanine:cation symporter family protein [Lawsonibacter sp.]